MAGAAQPELPAAVVAAVRERCSALPEVVEEPAWTGTRWCVRRRNFAHLVQVEDGWPPAYARAVQAEGPLTVLTFRVPEPEPYRDGVIGAPFHWPGWFADLVALVLPAAPAEADWQRIGELLVDSWSTLAPRRLVAQFDAARG